LSTGINSSEENFNTHITHRPDGCCSWGLACWFSFTGFVSCFCGSLEANELDRRHNVGWIIEVKEVISWYSLPKTSSAAVHRLPK
jgi:hypothetical protein